MGREWKTLLTAPIALTQQGLWGWALKIWLVAPRTRHGTLRELLERTMPSFLLSVDLAFDLWRHGAEPTARWDWPAEWSIESMTNIVTERIRRAPRPYGMGEFDLEIGTDTLSGKWTAQTALAVGEFLAAHVGSTERGVRLMLYGERVAMVLRR